MTENLTFAKNLLEACGYTCVLSCKDENITFTKRGVAPLLSLLDEKKDCSAYSAADKVVGNGAAYLYVLLKIKEVYAAVISRAAYKTLEDNGVTVYFGLCTDYIKNRAGDGKCPIEQSVEDATSPADALTKIRNKLKELR